MSRAQKKASRVRAGWRATAWMLLIIIKCHDAGRLVTVREVQNTVRRLAGTGNPPDLFEGLRSCYRQDFTLPNDELTAALNTIVAARISELIKSGHLEATGGKLVPVQPMPILKLLPIGADQLVRDLLLAGRL